MLFSSTTEWTGKEIITKNNSNKLVTITDDHTTANKSSDGNQKIDKAEQSKTNTSTQPVSKKMHIDRNPLFKCTDCGYECSEMETIPYNTCYPYSAGGLSVYFKVDSCDEIALMIDISCTISVGTYTA